MERRQSETLRVDYGIRHGEPPSPQRHQRRLTEPAHPPPIHNPSQRSHPFPKRPTRIDCETEKHLPPAQHNRPIRMKPRIETSPITQALSTQIAVSSAIASDTTNPSVRSQHTTPPYLEVEKTKRCCAGSPSATQSHYNALSHLLSTASYRLTTTPTPAPIRTPTSPAGKAARTLATLSSPSRPSSLAPRV